MSRSSLGRAPVWGVGPSAVLDALGGAQRIGPWFRRPFFVGASMAITESQYFLEGLAWRASAEIRSGRWLVSGRSCGQTVISIADTEEEAWSAACSMALDVTAPSLRERREGRS